MSTPLIKSLRSQYPGAHISWLVQEEASDLLTANPALDEVIIWPRKKWKQLWVDLRWLRLMGAVYNFVKLLRSRRFDMVIDLQGLLKSGLWARITGAPVRIGLGSKEGSALLMSRIIDKPDDDDRIGPEYRHLARVLGLQYSEFDMDVVLGDEDVSYATQLIKTHNLSVGYIVICPYTTRPQKHWVESHWVMLARASLRAPWFRPATAALTGPVRLPSSHSRSGPCCCRPGRSRPCAPPCSRRP